MVVEFVIDGDFYLDSFDLAAHEEYNNRYDGPEKESAFNENPEFECLVLYRHVCEWGISGIVRHDHDEVVHLCDNHDKLKTFKEGSERFH